MSQHKKLYAYLVSVNILVSLLCGCGQSILQAPCSSRYTENRSPAPLFNDHYNYLKEGPNQIQYNAACQENSRQRKNPKYNYNSYDPQPKQQAEAQNSRLKRERKIASEHAEKRARAEKEWQHSNRKPHPVTSQFEPLHPSFASR
jgi:hypothetical protein